MDAVELEVMAEIDMAVETVGTAEEDIWSDVKDAIVNKKERERLYVRVYVCISCRTVFIKGCQGGRVCVLLCLHAVGGPLYEYGQIKTKCSMTALLLLPHSCCMRANTDTL